MRLQNKNIMLNIYKKHEQAITATWSVLSDMIKNNRKQKKGYFPPCIVYNNNSVIVTEGNVNKFNIIFLNAVFCYLSHTNICNLHFQMV